MLENQNQCNVLDRLAPEANHRRHQRRLDGPGLNQLRRSRRKPERAVLRKQMVLEKRKSDSQGR